MLGCFKGRRTSRYFVKLQPVTCEMTQPQMIIVLVSLADPPLLNIYHISLSKAAS